MKLSPLRRVIRVQTLSEQQKTKTKNILTGQLKAIVQYRSLGGGEMILAGFKLVIKENKLQIGNHYLSHQP